MQLKYDKRNPQKFLKSFKEYWKARLKKALNGKKVLVKRELKYLLGETGSGQRLDEELVDLLFKSSIYSLRDKTLKPIKEKKLIIQKKVLDGLYSENNLDLLLRIVGKFIKSSEVLTRKPLIIKAKINNIPIRLLIKNGEWILPNEELVDFLKSCFYSKQLPIILAKKIHISLFPIFKQFSIIGREFYKSFVSNEVFIDISSFNKKNMKIEIKYNEQIGNISDFYKDLNNNNYDENNMLWRFLEDGLTIINSEYHEQFIKQKMDFNEKQYIDIIKQLPNQEEIKGLIELFKIREYLIRTLKEN